MAAIGGGDWGLVTSLGSVCSKFVFTLSLSFQRVFRKDQSDIYPLGRSGSTSLDIRPFMQATEYTGCCSIEMGDGQGCYSNYNNFPGGRMNEDLAAVTIKLTAEEQAGLGYHLDRGGMTS